jgi:uncharacterized membrane protein YeaQ/YmgE (transglycosylase-associated protein family)
MTLVGFLILMLIAAVAGAIGQSIAGYSLGGCFVSVAVGFIGALIGGWLAGAIGLPELFVVQIAGFPFPIIWSIIGATLFSLLIGVATRGRGRL